MPALAKELRTRLENTVKTARDTAEAGARAALRLLAVDAPEPFSHLTPPERELRNRLRAHARQLGDHRDARGNHGIEHLVVECAYEHWHRMLFARFLAENNLLMHPTGAPVTLDECEELAPSEGAANGWELAGRYASRMLPQIFRPDAPVLQVRLAPEHQRALEKLLADLTPETFTASDSLGWVYQFWQAKKKDEVNRSEVKIGADELPAVTQLFTEPYMVAFLLDNSLGAWWAWRCDAETRGRGDAGIFETVESEEELRRACALPGVPLTYLRFVQTDYADAENTAPPPLPLAASSRQAWTPAAGTFDRWPEKLAELKTLDPCCGSGHFLVAALYMLVAMRMELEGLSARDAVDAVLRDNLHGLEIDERCTELAAFALALAAWTYPEAGGYRELPELQVACSGLGINAKREDWVALAGDNPDLQRVLGELHKTFRDAQVLGSLINPGEGLRTTPLFSVPWEELSPLLARALSEEQDDARHELGAVAQGIVRASQLLAAKYHWVITNVPYLARGKQGDAMRDYCESNHGVAKNDLATVFLDRCLAYCSTGSSTSIVLPQNWLFLSTFRRFREQLLESCTWKFLARMGPGAFDTITGEVVKAILLTLTQSKPSKESCFCGLDVSDGRNATEKSVRLLTEEVVKVAQLDQRNNPDSIVALDQLSQDGLLRDFVSYSNGVQAGDVARFTNYFWEVEAANSSIWSPLQRPVNRSDHFGGLDSVFRWESGRGCYWDYVTKRLGDGGQRAWVRGLEYHGKSGVAISATGRINSVTYCGGLWNDSLLVLTPHDEANLAPVLSYCCSDEFEKEVRKVDKKLNVRSAVTKVPFDLSRWSRVAEDMYPNGLPKPYSNDPTQWIFHGHPCGSVVWDESNKCTIGGRVRSDDGVLQVTVSRLLGYCWPAELDSRVHLDKEQRSWADRCSKLTPLGDDDGIVCIPSVRGEEPGATRLTAMLAAAYADAWSPAKQEELLVIVGCGGKGLEHWLREKFSEQHCALFHQRPFIWHIWDGIKRDGFAALVNYHKLDRKLLETLTYNYLGDWIKRQEDEDRANGRHGDGEKTAAAKALKKKLELILEGEPPYDIFVRWKPIEEQPLGWEPDLNDGVRLNIRPFVEAGVLCKNPKIKWKKDRGKDPEDAPWYHLFKGDRINDHHLTLAEKRAARSS